MGTVIVAAARQTGPIGPGTEDTANWNKRYGNFTPWAVAADSSGNIYVVGYGYNLVSGSSGQDWVIKKFSTAGVEDTANWNKAISSAGQNGDFAYTAALDASGNLYVAGSGGDLINGTSEEDIWIKKFSSSGVEDTVNWNKKFSSTNGGDHVNSIAVDSAGNVFVAGFGCNLASGSSAYDWWVKKFSSAGVEDTVNWNKKISSAGANDDEAFALAVDSSGNVYVVGRGEDLVSGTSSWDWWIKKFSNTGTEDTVNWNKKFDGGANPAARSVVIDSSGNVFVAGYGQHLANANSYFDGWIKKFSSGGIEDTSNWNKILPRSGDTTNEAAMCLKLDTSNNVYVVGYSESEGWIKKYSNAGVEDTVNWNKVIDTGSAFSAGLDASGDLYVVGPGYNLVGNNTEDGWIKKYRGK